MTALRELAERQLAVRTDYSADELLQILDAEGDGGAVDGWIEGYPNHVYASEWFIAETVYNDRVVLQALSEENSYDFTTADHTYMRKENIKRWMQFPDSEFIPSTRSHPVRSVVVSDDERDAERYRWLRANAIDLIEEDRGNGSSYPYGDDLDAAIDAAIKSQGESNV